MTFRTIAFGHQSVDLLEEGDRICIGLAAGKAFEKESRAWWADMLEQERWDETSTVLDIGAYTGIYAIAAAKHGYYAIAIEPLPENMGRLDSNIFHNGVSKMVTKVAAAASDTDGRGELAYNSGVPFTSGGSLTSKKEGYTRIPVDLVTIDTLIGRMLVNKHIWITAMKLDVERGEAAALRGAVWTIKRCSPKIILEILDIDQLLEVEAVLLPLGYWRAHQFDRRNFVYLPPIKLKAMEAF